MVDRERDTVAGFVLYIICKSAFREKFCSSNRKRNKTFSCIFCVKRISDASLGLRHENEKAEKQKKKKKRTKAM